MLQSSFWRTRTPYSSVMGFHGLSILGPSALMSRETILKNSVKPSFPQPLLGEVYNFMNDSYNQKYGLVPPSENLLPANNVLSLNLTDFSDILWRNLLPLHRLVYCFPSEPTKLKFHLWRIILPIFFIYPDKELFCKCKLSILVFLLVKACAESWFA